MIIEFAGCSGSGKTSLSAAVIVSLERRGISVMDCRNSRCGLHGSFLNLACVPAGFLWIILDWKACKEFLGTALRIMIRHCPNAFWLTMRTMSLIRITGKHLRLRRRSTESVCIVDEGILTCTHLVFGGCVLSTEKEEIAFASCLLTSDIVVLVTAPHDVLLERLWERDDPPRELSRLRTETLCMYLVNVAKTFRYLANSQTIRKRVMFSENSSSSKEVLAKEAERIAKAICERLSQDVIAV